MDAADSNEVIPEETGDDGHRSVGEEADAEVGGEASDDQESVDDVDPEAPEEELPFVLHYVVRASTQ